MACDFMCFHSRIGEGICFILEWPETSPLDGKVLVMSPGLTAAILVPWAKWAWDKPDIRRRVDFRRSLENGVEQPLSTYSSSGPVNPLSILCKSVWVQLSSELSFKHLRRGLSRWLRIYHSNLQFGASLLCLHKWRKSFYHVYFI